MYACNHVYMISAIPTALLGMHHPQAS